MNILEAIKALQKGHLVKLKDEPWVYKAYSINKMEIEDGKLNTYISHYLYAKILPYKEERLEWSREAVDVVSWGIKEVESNEWEVFNG